MSERVLFICNTTYQLLTAIQLKLTLHSKDQVTLILSDQFSGAEIIARNASKSGLFVNVEFIRNKKQSFKSRACESLHDLFLIWRIRQKFGPFDHFCFSNISVFSILISRFYQVRPHRTSIFEDGFVTYSRAFELMDKGSVFSRLLFPHGLLGIVSNICLFTPELLEWRHNSIKVCKIPQIQREDDNTIKLFNSIFGYKERDRYDRKYIFMEESFYADHFPVDDVGIIKKITETVGIDNLMVKLHPRNGENRFASLGIKTNTYSGIPWELICLNQNIRDCTLISISSSSILQPYLLFGIQVRCFALLSMIKEKPGNMNGPLGEFMETLFSSFPDICSVPKDADQFYSMLS